MERLIAAGLVQRVPCPTDRRVSFATLTKQGRAKLAAASTVHAANLRAVFAGFSAGDLQTLDDQLDRLRVSKR